MRRSEIERLLPGVFQRSAGDGTVLHALLDAMEGLHAPSEAALERLDASLDPRRAPEAFLPLLARWVDLDVTVTTGPRRWRELIAAAAELARWRGTRRGLIHFLELATGATSFEVVEEVPFHIHVIAPASTRPHQTMLERIVQREKLAHVTYQLTFRETH